jgi:hypothetical protein
MACDVRASAERRPHDGKPTRDPWFVHNRETERGHERDRGGLRADSGDRPTLAWVLFSPHRKAGRMCL